MAKSPYLIATLLVFAASGVAQEHRHDASHLSHHDAVKQRGAMAMGFDQEKTTHHFRLTPNGGYVEVQVKDRDDAASLERVRAHLSQLPQLFGSGDFSAPFLTHARVPPGAQTMERLKSQIEYKYEETERGGKVLMSTAHPKALDAIHKFLRFQIEDHQTGDPVAVEKR